MPENKIIVRVERRKKKEIKDENNIYNHFLKTIAVVNGKEYLLSQSFVDDKLLLICNLANIEIVNVD